MISIWGVSFIYELLQRFVRQNLMNDSSFRTSIAKALKSDNVNMEGPTNACNLVYEFLSITTTSSTKIRSHSLCLISETHHNFSWYQCIMVNQIIFHVTSHPPPSSSKTKLCSKLPNFPSTNQMKPTFNFSTETFFHTTLQKNPIFTHNAYGGHLFLPSFLFWFLHKLIACLSDQYLYLNIQDQEKWIIPISWSWD